MTSGAIQATVPANDILVLFSFHCRLVPKSLIFTTSFAEIRTLKKTKHMTNKVSHTLEIVTQPPERKLRALICTNLYQWMAMEM